MSDLVEYPPGGEFPGVIGRTVQESSPAWPAPVRAKDGAPNVLFFVLDDVGYGQLSCFGGLVETPNIDRVAASGPALREHAHDRAVLADARVHPDRPQPPLQRRGLHHGARDRLPRLRRADAARERHARGDAAAAWLQHVLPRQVALSPSEENTPAGPLHRWPLGRGFERFYGFLGGETNQWYPDLTLDNGPDDAAEEGRGGLPPQRGPRRPGDQVHARRARQRAREAVLHVLRARAARTRRTTCRRSGPTATRASSTMAGTPTARRCSRASRRSGSSAPTSSSRRATRTSRSGRRCPPTSAGCTRA